MQKNLQASVDQEKACRILPDGEFLPAMEMNVVEKDVAARIKEHYKGQRHMLMGRIANITVPHNRTDRTASTEINVGWVVRLALTSAHNQQHCLQPWQPAN